MMYTIQDVQNAMQVEDIFEFRIQVASSCEAIVPREGPSFDGGCCSDSRNHLACCDTHLPFRGPFLLTGPRCLQHSLFLRVALAHHFSSIATILCCAITILRDKHCPGRRKHINPCARPFL